MGDPLEQLTLLISGSQVRALVRPPGSFRAQTFAIGLAFIARKCRFSRSLRVSESVSDWQIAGLWRPVSAVRISVPGGVVGDRFDDWVVGHQFEPNYLHHPVFGNLRRRANTRESRFCGHFLAISSSLILVSTGLQTLEL